jgi:hypothetical protein
MEDGYCCIFPADGVGDLDMRLFMHRLCTQFILFSQSHLQAVSGLGKVGGERAHCRLGAKFIETWCRRDRTFVLVHHPAAMRFLLSIIAFIGLFTFTLA